MIRLLTSISSEHGWAYPAGRRPVDLEQHEPGLEARMVKTGQAEWCDPLPKPEALEEEPPEDLPEGLDEETGEQSRDAFMAELRIAIESLDPDDPEHYTASGVPRVDALEELLGRDITAADRTEAWGLYQDEED